MNRQFSRISFLVLTLLCGCGGRGGEKVNAAHVEAFGA